MITLKDIAKEAGVSVMTVSRVVNGRLDKVSAKNAERIRAIIKERGYVPNSSARTLSSKASRIIAILISSRETRLSDPYNAAMVGNICFYVQERGYSPMIFFEERYHNINRRLRTWNAEGAVFLGLFDDVVKEIQEEDQIPLVFTDCYSPVRQITNIGIDDYKGGALAAKHFIENGHSSMAFIGSPLGRSSVVRQRLIGFSQVLLESGIELPREQILDRKSEMNALKELCLRRPNPVTAVFAPADVEAIQLMDRLREWGIRVPQDCSVIGFDNLPLCTYPTPKLTTIAQDINKKAKITIDVLFRHIAEPESPAESVVLDVDFIERDSVRRLTDAATP